MATKKILGEYGNYGGLETTRLEYITAQIDYESGMKGLLRKMGFLKDENDILKNHLEATRESYHIALHQSRDALSKSLAKGRKKLEKNKLMALAQSTIFDEVTRFREDKEMLLRSRGIKGVLRTQLEDWRETSPNFKIWLGLFLVFLTLIMEFIEFWDLNRIQMIVLAWGIMMFIEGAMQKIYRRKSVRNGKNRINAYQSAKKLLDIRIEKTKSFLAEMVTIHRKLEDDIADIREYEKRFEVKRYFFAFTIGALLGSVFLLPIGVKTVIASTASSIGTRLLWFILPSSALASAGGLGGIFGSGPANPNDFTIGEGADHQDINSYMNYVSRASYSDVAFTQAQQLNTLNPLLTPSLPDLATLYPVETQIFSQPDSLPPVATTGGTTIVGDSDNPDSDDSSTTGGTTVGDNPDSDDSSTTGGTTGY